MRTPAFLTVLLALLSVTARGQGKTDYDLIRSYMAYAAKEQTRAYELWLDAKPSPLFWSNAEKKELLQRFPQLDTVTIIDEQRRFIWRGEQLDNLFSKVDSNLQAPIDAIVIKKLLGIRVGYKRTRATPTVIYSFSAPCYISEGQAIMRVNRSQNLTHGDSCIVLFKNDGHAWLIQKQMACASM